MKRSAKVAIFVMSMFVTMNAMGGSGLGGGILARTGELLKGLPHDRAYLSFSGASSLLETETLPKLLIPREEYDFLVNAFQQEGLKEVEPIMLQVELKDGRSRHFALHHLQFPGKGPVFLYLVEQAAAE